MADIISISDAISVMTIILLLVAIVYGYRLNQRISLIQDSKRELSLLFKSFDHTIEKAQYSVDILKKVSLESAKGLQEKIDKALVLTEDLSLLSERSEAVLQRLEAERTKKMTKLATADKHKLDLNATKDRQSSALYSDNSYSENNAPQQHHYRREALQTLLENIAKTKQGQQQTEKSKDQSRPKPKFSLLRKKKSENNQYDENETVTNMLKALGYGVQD